MPYELETALPSQTFQNAAAHIAAADTAYRLHLFLPP
jgi:hypothetical protein